MSETARLFQALADDTRLRLVALLMEGELCVCDMVAVLSLPQSTVSRHLASLRNAGLVEGRREGVWMHYRLDAGEGLKAGLLELLKEKLAGMKQVRDDRRVLKKFLAGKKAAAC